MDQCCGYIIYDQHTGDSICTTCCRVKNTGRENVFTIENLLLSHSEFVELCEKKHISRAIVGYALDLHAKREKYDKNEAAAVAADLAYCLYEAFCKYDAKRSVKEIADLMHLDARTKKIFFAKCTEDKVKPSDLISRVCQQLELLDFKFHTKIARLADDVYENQLLSHTPQTVLAGTLMLVVASEKLAITPKTIAAACDVSPACMRRASRLIAKNWQASAVVAAADTAAAAAAE